MQLVVGDPLTRGPVQSMTLTLLQRKIQRESNEADKGAIALENYMRGIAEEADPASSTRKANGQVCGWTASACGYS